MSACTFAELAVARDTAATFLEAASAPGWLPEERERLRGAADAVLAGRDLLQHHARRPLIRRDRIAAAGPVIPDGPPVTIAEAAAQLGLSQGVVYARARQRFLGNKDAGGQLRLSQAEHVRICHG